MRALVTGATGFVGERLVQALAADGGEVRCLVCDRARAAGLERAGHELHEGDVLDPGSLAGAGQGVDVAYYLIHSMGGGSGFAARERAGGAVDSYIRPQSPRAATFALHCRVHAVKLPHCSH